MEFVKWFYYFWGFRGFCFFKQKGLEIIPQCSLELCFSLFFYITTFCNNTKDHQAYK